MIVIYIYKYIYIYIKSIWVASTTKQAYHGNPENPAPCSNALSHPTPPYPTLPTLPLPLPYPPYPNPGSCLSRGHLRGLHKCNGRTAPLDSPPSLPCPTLPYPTLPYPTLRNLPWQPRKPCPSYALSQETSRATPKTLPQLCPFSGSLPGQPRKPCPSNALSLEAYHGNPENPAPVMLCPFSRSLPWQPRKPCPMQKCTFSRSLPWQPRKPCPSYALSQEAYQGN